MRNVKIERTVAAPPSSVWAVLADYPDIADWNDGVMESFAIGDATDGVGAVRQCNLAPNGKMSMRETVTEWVTDEKMAIAIDEIEKMPIKTASMTFGLADEGSGATTLTMHYRYEPKGGPLALVLGPMMDKQMRKGFNGFVDSLEAEVSARAAQ